MNPHTPLLSLLAGAAALAAAPGDLAPGWPVYVGGVIYGAPAIGPRGEVVVACEGTSELTPGTVLSLNPDGSVRWIFDDAGDWFDSSPAIGPDGTVYIGCWDNRLYALDGATGSLKWVYPQTNDTGGLMIASPTIGPDGTVYIGSFDGQLYAIKPDGTLRWTYEPMVRVMGLETPDGSPVTSGAVLNRSGDTVYFGTENGNFYAVNAATGARRWFFSIPSTYTTDRAISGAAAVGEDGSIYFGGENGVLYALYPAGLQQWFFNSTEGIRSSPIVGPDGTIHFAAQDGYLYSVDAAGFELAETFVGDVFYCTPAMDAAGNIIIGAYAGSASTGPASAFRSVGPAGTVNWSYYISGYNDSSPNIAPDGSIYIGAHDGFLYKFEGQAPLLADGWPRFHANRRQTGRIDDLYAVELVDWFPTVGRIASAWDQPVPWYGSAWLDWIGTDFLWNPDHGWIHVGAASTAGLELHDPAQPGWLHATVPNPAYLYHYASGHWLYLAPGTSAPWRWFYDFASGSWLAENQL